MVEAILRSIVATYKPITYVSKKEEN